MQEEEKIKSILEVYDQEMEIKEKEKGVDKIVLEPFKINYNEQSGNDKQFSLKLYENMIFKQGDVIVLTGASGSGKSTFMKLITNRIRVKKSVDISSTVNFMYYDENLKMGRMSIFEELFCGSENPNLEKMRNILENLHLWQEIECICMDVWQWLKDKKFEDSLSNGQKQRIILAKILYWLDSKIDVLVLDEATSGLDDKSGTDLVTADEILEYIIKYANYDKKRILFIATHQDISGLQRKLENRYNFQNLNFQKENMVNVIRKI